MGELAAQAVARWRAIRDEALAEFDRLSDQDLRGTTAVNGIERSANFLIRQLGNHDLDHLAHIIKLLERDGRHQTEARVLLGKIQAIHGELEALLLGLSDEEFTRERGPDEWSVAKIVDHLIEAEQRYGQRIRTAVANARAR